MVTKTLMSRNCNALFENVNLNKKGKLSKNKRFDNYDMITLMININ